MNQHHLRLLGDVVVAVGHRDRGQLVGHNDGLDVVGILLGGFRQRLNEGAMVGAGIGEQISNNAKRPHLLQKSLGAGAYSNRVIFFSHGKVPFSIGVILISAAKNLVPNAILPLHLERRRKTAQLCQEPGSFSTHELARRMLMVEFQSSIFRSRPET